MRTKAMQQSKSIIRRTLLRLAAVLGLCTLVACESPAVISTSSVAPEQSVLAYYEWLQSASPAALETELGVLNRGASSNALQHDIKLALLLSAQSNDSDDAAKEEEAMRLLNNVSNANGRDNLPVDYRIFAGSWLGYLQQRQKLRDFANLQQNSEAMLQQLENTYHDLEERYARLSQVMNSLETQNDLLAQQNKLMQQQIDALTLIEQQLVEREQTRPTANAAEGSE